MTDKRSEIFVNGSTAQVKRLFRTSQQWPLLATITFPRLSAHTSVIASAVANLCEYFPCWILVLPLIVNIRAIVRISDNRSTSPPITMVLPVLMAMGELSALQGRNYAY
jgi:hypothetical protein